MKIKYAALAMTTMLAIGAVGTAIPMAVQADNTDTVIDERWGKPTFVAGAGLSAAQKEETMNILGITADQVNTQTATGADLIKYLGSGSGDDAAMLSSVVVTRKNEGSGITVDIVTPENITLITADQYKNPLVTAGVTDASIKVGSVVKVTGESALTGVYKAFEANGETIDSDRAQLAQTELATTTDVANEITEEATSDNADMTEEEKQAANEAYQTQLNQTLVDIKKELADLKEQKGDSVTAAEVEEIVNNAIKNNGLSEYISQDSINQLISLAQQYLNTEGVLSKESIAQLDKISEGFQNTLNSIGDKFGNLTSAVKANEGFFQGLWNSITDFFGNLFN
ncbi:DUF1002 domain-containing protein [Enterococcus sp. BWM-S5]|uniref:DUF1002 domain-containing protein n=1 Tax=Enterococcus larvae TaxID=2794352 RepID=A0ABS4CG08_9ENTE|nr:DUF1002 domain-containing protein [Enterococcus larvae]MBP1045482.1 DUF1002 domain-containing protein [Enterococcus larvae]